MNESKFHGSVHYQEAKDKIFIKALGLPASLLKSVKMCFNKHLNIQFILHKEIDITKLPAVNFHIERKYHSGGVQMIDKIECRLTGLPKPKPKITEKANLSESHARTQSNERNNQKNQIIIHSVLFL